MSWSDSITGLEETPTEPVKIAPSKPIKWSEELTGGGGGFSDPDPTVPGGPRGLPLNSVMTEVGSEGAAPDFMSQAKQGLLTNPQLAIKYASEARFPKLPPSEREAKYGVHKGELVYQDDNGKLQYETPDNWFDRFKRFSIRTSTDPTITGAIAGSLAPGIGTVLGAMGGEVWKKNIQHSLGQEDPSIGKVAKDVGLAGAEAYGGELVGRGIGKGINYLGAKRGGQLAAAAGRDRSKINVSEVQRLEDLGNKYGVDLYPPSTTGSKRLADKWKLLGDLPDTADDIAGALKKTTDQVDKAFYRQLDAISTPASSMEAGTSLVKASRSAIDTVVAQRRKLAGPLYKNSLERNAVVDIEPIIENINAGMAGSKADILDAYTNIKKILTKPDLPKVTPSSESTILNAAGKPAFSTPEIVNYETNLKGLHDALVAINHKVEISKNPLGQLTPVGEKYNEVRKQLRSVLRDADPEYAQAMDLYREGSEFVNEIADSTLIGGISKLKGDKKIHATQRLLSSSDSDPVTIARARIVLVDGMGEIDTWNKALRFELQRQFETIKGMASSDTQNLGGQAAKKIFGSPMQRQRWESAMSPSQFETITDFFEVLDKTKLIFGKESATASRQVSLEEMKREGGSSVLTAGENLTRLTELPNLVAKGFAKANNVLRGRYNKELAESLLSEQAHEQIKAMLQLPPGSPELIGKFTAFLTMVAGQESGRRSLQSNTKDSLPLSMRPTLETLIERQR